MKLTSSLICGAMLAASQPALANIDIVFDYTYDSSGFFTGANSSRQTLLNDAASVFETRFGDTLSAITSSGSNHFNADFFNPSNGSSTTINDFSVLADKLVVYVGAFNLGSGTLGQGGPGGFSAGGSSAFLNNASSRGEPGALGTPASQTDFGPWGGSISFNSTSPWYFDSNTGTTESFSGFNFYSVAIHELGHVLGFSTADSFSNHISGGVFTGTAVNALTGSGQAVTADGHWAEGLSYLGQETAMDPTIAAGQRKLFTELDFAAMKDLGWEVSPVPEAETWGMMLAGLGLLGWRLRTRQSA